MTEYGYKIPGAPHDYFVRSVCTLQAIAIFLSGLSMIQFRSLMHRFRYLPVLALGILALPGVTAERTGPVVVPDNAYATGSIYGSGWACVYGYRQRAGACDEVMVPANAYLNSNGTG